MSETPEAKNKILMRIDALCRERSWSHYQLAIVSGISASTINNMFRRNSYPSFPDHDKDIFLAYLHGLMHLSDNGMKENGTKPE